MTCTTITTIVNNNSNDHDHDYDYERDTLGPYDVLCGRDRCAFNTVGNRRFRIIVALNLDRYVESPSRQEKSRVVWNISQQIKRNGGRFVKYQNGHLVELSDKLVQQKVGHSIRDKLGHYQSHSKEARKTDKASCNGDVDSWTQQLEPQPCARSGQQQRRRSSCSSFARLEDLPVVDPLQQEMDESVVGSTATLRSEGGVEELGDDERDQDDDFSLSQEERVDVERAYDDVFSSF